MVRPGNLKSIEFKGLRGKIAEFVESRFFIKAITAVILVNAITLGLETDDRIAHRYGDALMLFDQIVLIIFCIELLLKLYIYRLSFFRQGWNVFDFVIVGIALMPSSGPLAVLRALRILRVLRLMSVVPSMRRVITGLFRALPGMASIIGVLLLLFYVSAVLATKLFGESGNDDIDILFGSVPASMYTLFQVMTLEGWSDGIVRPTMDLYPWAWVFFIPFIIMTSFAVLNLFIGIIVDAMQQEDKMTSPVDLENMTQITHDNIQNLQIEISKLRQDLQSLKGAEDKS